MHIPAALPPEAGKSDRCADLPPEAGNTVANKSYLLPVTNKSYPIP